jgi:hypothetical protein
MKNKIPLWIVVGQDEAICERCGGSEQIHKTISVEVMEKWLRYFVARHRDCEEVK